MERGFSLVRTGQIGLMTASDASGVVLAEDDRLAIADVPTGHVETVYGQDLGVLRGAANTLVDLDWRPAYMARTLIK